jgi:hypothetical protein
MRCLQPSDFTLDHLYHPAKHSNKKHQKLEAWIRIRVSGQPFKDLLLMSLDRFFSGKILAGGLLNIFFDFLFL